MQIPTFCENYTDFLMAEGPLEKGMRQLHPLLPLSPKSSYEIRRLLSNSGRLAAGEEIVGVKDEISFGHYSRWLARECGSPQI